MALNPATTINIYLLLQKKGVKVIIMAKKAGKYKKKEEYKKEEEYEKSDKADVGEGLDEEF